MGEKIILIGSGGHSKVIADIILRQGDQILGCLDDNPHCDTFGYPYLGVIEDIKKYRNHSKCILAIGDNLTRKRLANILESTGPIHWKTAIHPTAQIGSRVTIGEGTVIMPNVVINADAKIGAHCIMNTGAIVEHDNKISDYVHLSPRAVLGGNVEIGETSHIGIGATIKNQIVIEAGTVIGAGAVVVKNIKKAGIYLGIPAKEKKTDV